MMQRLLFILSLLIGLFVKVSGQSLESFLEANKEHAELIIQDKVEYALFMQKGKFVAERKSFKESIILSEKGLHNNSESFITSSIQPVVEFEAYTILPASKKNKKVKVTEITESSGKQNFVFYDDVIEKKFSFSNLEIGAKKYLYHKSVFNDPLFVHGQTFLRLEPAFEIELVVRCSKDIELGYQVMNDINAEFQFTKKTDGSDIIYTWKKMNIKPIKFESNAPSYLHFAPHIALFVKSQTQDDKVIPFLGTTDLLHKRYGDYVKELNKKDDEGLKSLTMNLIKDLTTEEEKVKAIYYWVKKNIKYIAIENGYEGLIPRQAALVFDRKYGDCKDMASIITDMARYAGIPNVYLAWIGTRDLPYDYKVLPTMAADNHMIAVYRNKDELVYLDATDKQVKFGFPSSFIQGKEALINTQNSKFEVARVPVIEAEKNTITHNVNIKLNGQILDGKANIVCDGYSRANLLSKIGDMESKKRLDYYRNAFQMGNNKFMLKSFTEKDLEEIDKPLQVDLEFSINNYVVSVDDEMYLNLSLMKPLEKEILEKDRTLSYEVDELILNNTNVTFEVPLNKVAKQLPENFKLDNELIRFESSYTNLGNQIKVVNKCQLKKLMIHKPDFELWNKSINELKKQYNEVIVLKNKS
jgi:hypothetical protein